MTMISSATRLGSAAARPHLNADYNQCMEMKGTANVNRTGSVRLPGRQGII
jgi:hypothetical protein